MKKKIVLIGGGGHAKVVIDAIKCSKKYAIFGIVDPKLRVGDTVLGVKVLGGDEVLCDMSRKRIKHAFIGIASIGKCKLRKEVYKRLKTLNFELPVVVHPKAIVASSVELGEGTFVAVRAVVNPCTKIGRNAIINTSSSVDHDCIIGDFVHISPGVTLSGGVKVGDETHIGTGATVIQNLTIGKRCIIGAGQTIRHDMADGSNSFGQGAVANEYD